MKLSQNLIRKLNIKRVLKHGQMKVLAEKMGTKPNYLSQLFSIKSERDISDGMAKSIEEVLQLPKGALDNPIDDNDIGLINSPILNAELNRIDNQRADRRKQQTLAEELTYRRLKEYYPDLKLLSHLSFKFMGEIFTPDIVCQATDKKPKIIVEIKVANQDTSIFGSKIIKSGIEHVATFMSITGADYGLVMILLDYQLEEYWLCMTDRLQVLSGRPDL